VPREKHGPLLEPGGGYVYVVRTREVPLLYIGSTTASVRRRFFTHVKNYGGYSQVLAAYLESHPEERSSTRVVVFQLASDLREAEGIFNATLQPLLNAQHKRDYPRPSLRLDDRAGIYDPE
jgi:predicted GIY-YIG superfamily endonuclease